MTGSQLSGSGAGSSDHLEDRLEERLDEALTQLAAAAERAVPDRVLAQRKEFIMATIDARSASGSAGTKTPIDPPGLAQVGVGGGNAVLPRSLNGGWSTSARAARLRRKKVLVGGVVALGLVLAAGPAAAGQVMTWLGRAAVTNEEADHMQVIYRGQVLTWAEVNQLQKQGKALVTVQEPASYAQGEAHAFDTQAEANSWACTHVTSWASRPACRPGSAGGPATSVGAP